jgi:hypothetical protein
MSDAENPQANQQPPSYPGAPPPMPPYGQQYPTQQPFSQPNQGQQPFPGQPAPFGLRPKHPQAMVALVFGILGVALCQLFGPVAWVTGNKVVKEIDANPQAYDGRGEANAGRILGIIGTVILVLGFVAILGLLVLGLLADATFDDYESTSLISLFSRP